MTEFHKTYDGKKVYYDILDNGFKIYVGQTIRPSIHQYEPYIPDPSKSYEENAIQMCEDLCKPPENLLETRLNAMESNIDYLILLNDPDSVTEESVE